MILILLIMNVYGLNLLAQSVDLLWFAVHTEIFVILIQILITVWQISSWINAILCYSAI